MALLDVPKVTFSTNVLRVDIEAGYNYLGSALLSSL